MSKGPSSLAEMAKTAFEIAHPDHQRVLELAKDLTAFADNVHRHSLKDGRGYELKVNTTDQHVELAIQRNEGAQSLRSRTTYVRTDNNILAVLGDTGRNYNIGTPEGMDALKTDMLTVMMREMTPTQAQNFITSLSEKPKAAPAATSPWPNGLKEPMRNS